METRDRDKGQGQGTGTGTRDRDRDKGQGQGQGTGTGIRTGIRTIFVGMRCLYIFTCGEMAVAKYHACRRLGCSIVACIARDSWNSCISRDSCMSHTSQLCSSYSSQYPLHVRSVMPHSGVELRTPVRPESHSLFSDIKSICDRRLQGLQKTNITGPVHLDHHLLSSSSYPLPSSVPTTKDVSKEIHAT